MALLADQPLGRFGARSNGRLGRLGRFGSGSGDTQTEPNSARPFTAPLAALIEADKICFYSLIRIAARLMCLSLYDVWPTIRRHHYY